MKPWILCALLLASCVSAADRADELLATDRAFARASGDKGLREALREYQAEDALLLNTGTRKRERTYAVLDGQFDDRHIVHNPRFARVCESGELGYTWGDWISRPRTADSARPAFGGSYVNVWTREPGGRWRLVLDGVAVLSPEQLAEFAAP
jgi:ketosteroid isomerase-like protein